jgi:hypothetical protein
MPHCFGNFQAAYRSRFVHFEEEPGSRSAAKLLNEGWGAADRGKRL